MAQRFEIAFPFRNKEYQPIPQADIQDAIREIGHFSNGYRQQRTFGWWKSKKRRRLLFFWEKEEEKIYFGGELLITSDIIEQGLDEFKWFYRKKIEWKQKFNYEEVYIATYTVDWL